MKREVEREECREEEKDTVIHRLTERGGGGGGEGFTYIYRFHLNHSNIFFIHIEHLFNCFMETC